MDFNWLGINKSEQKAYQALISLGRSSASRISRESGVSYGKIYEVLGSLEKKGLVKVLPGKHKQFAPENPEALMHMLDDHQLEMSELRNEIKNMQESFKAEKSYPVLITHGKRNFYKLMASAPESISYVYDINHDSEFHQRHVRDHAKSRARGMDTRVLARVADDTIANIKSWSEVRSDIKSFPNEGVTMRITDGSVFIGLKNSDTTLMVYDKSFIQIMKDLFLIAYEHSEKI